jgi:phage terminase large subunit-like protein
MVAYDRFAFRKFEEDVEQLGLDIEFVEHPQGGLKKGKASEAMKEAAKSEGRDPEGLWMPGSLKLLEDAMYEGRIRLLRNPLLILAIMSAVTDEDKWGNRWLAKLRSINKIDPAVALCMAVGAASATIRKPADEMLII